MLRIVSKADSADGFIQIFAHLCDRESLFIVTRSPKPIGTETRFSINLKSGEPIISGHGTVTERYETNSNPYGRPGMRLRFSELDDRSRAFIEKLVTSRERTPPRPRASSQAGAGDTPGPRSGPTVVGKRTPTTPPPQQEQRVPGSDFILPANPFGELTDNVLEAFVECSLYEETSTVPAEPEPAAAPSLPGVAAPSLPGVAAPSLPGVAAPGAAAQAQPGWSVDAGVRATGPLMVPVPVQASPPDLPGAPLVPVGDAANMAMPQMPPDARQVVTPPPMPAVQPQVAPFVTDIASMAASVPAVRSIALMDTMPAARPASMRAIMVPVAVAAAVAAMLSLGMGYLLWGRGGSDAGSEQRGAPEPGAVAAAAAPATEAPAAEAPAAASAGEAAATSDEPEPTPTAAQEDSASAEARTPAPGECEVHLTSDPSEATVFFSGREIGVTPLETVLPCGPAEFRLIRARRDPTLKTFTLTEGERNTFAVDLERPRVELSVTANQPDAKVLINGKAVGTTPVTLRTPGYRRVQIQVVKEGFKPYKTQIYLKDTGQSLRAFLTPDRRKRR